MEMQAVVLPILLLRTVALEGEYVRQLFDALVSAHLSKSAFQVVRSIPSSDSSMRVLLAMPRIRTSISKLLFNSCGASTCVRIPALCTADAQEEWHMTQSVSFNGVRHRSEAALKREGSSSMCRVSHDDELSGLLCSLIKICSGMFIAGLGGLST